MNLPKGVQPAVLVILDGFGLAPAGPYNAISQAKAPTIHSLLDKAVHSQLITHGEEVGLPPGVMGNSEVGHMNIGSGRIVWQELSRINKEIREGKFQKNAVILGAIRKAKESGARLHLMGLLSDGGVHSHQDHLYELLKICKAEGLKKVSVHPFLDGRDTPPQSAPGYLAQLQAQLKTIGIGEVATISGRYYSMDRDKRWERTGLAYNALWGEDEKGKPVDGANAPANADQALQASYNANVNDEFVKPVVLLPESCLKKGDQVFFFNYRADRARQIVSALGLKDFAGFTRAHPAVDVTCLTQYDEHYPFPVAYEPSSLTHILGDVIADAGLKQFRIAETEKYAHVTFFFNGGREAPLAGEERILIPSPRDVATYDLKPAMSALEVTQKLVAAIRRKEFAFLVANFANADMVGHTGIFAAAVKAVETLDKCLKEIRQAAAECGYHLFISADHGNIEQMQDAGGVAHTQHTLNPVPFVYCSPDSLEKDAKEWKLDKGILADIMPTMLHAMHLPIPKEVTGKNLLKKKK